jgi:hypothetical protein
MIAHEWTPIHAKYYSPISGGTQTLALNIFVSIAVDSRASAAGACREAEKREQYGMTTTLESLRRALAEHDLTLAGLLCAAATGASCAERRPGWTARLFDEICGGDDATAILARALPRIEEAFAARVLRPLYDLGLTGRHGADAGEACMRSLLERLRMVLRVAATKVDAADERLRAAVRAGDAAMLDRLITYPMVEAAVIGRVQSRAVAFAREQALPAVAADRLVAALGAIYGEWLIPFSRELQVEWLLNPPASTRPRRGVRGVGAGSGQAGRSVSIDRSASATRSLRPG